MGGGDPRPGDRQEAEAPLLRERGDHCHREDQEEAEIEEGLVDQDQVEEAELGGLVAKITVSLGSSRPRMKMRDKARTRSMKRTITAKKNTMGKSTTKARRLKVKETRRMMMGRQRPPELSANGRSRKGGLCG